MPTESEQRLYAAMLHAIAMDLYTTHAVISLPGGEFKDGPRQTERGRKGCVTEDYFQGYRKQAFELLAGFGLVKPVKHDGSPASRADHTGHWTLAVDIDDTVTQVLETFPERLPTIDQALAGVIGVARLATGRAAFVPAPEYLPLLQLLAEHGYAGRVGDKFRWTDKAAPAMQAAYLWDDNDQSSADLHEAQLD